MSSAASISSLLFDLFIFPPLLHHHPSSIVIIDIIKKHHATPLFLPYMLTVSHLLLHVYLFWLVMSGLAQLFSFYILSSLKLPCPSFLHIFIHVFHCFFILLSNFLGIYFCSILSLSSPPLFNFYKTLILITLQPSTPT